MAQLFSPSFGFRVRLIAILTGLLLAAVLLLLRSLTAYPAGIGDPLQQPVPFSHKHHVADDGIDCRYCHGAVETSAFAGIPPLSTCMTCHSQLYTDQEALAPLVKAFTSGTALHWQRVNKLPDFVYFNHAIHIAKGVGCASCHGAVDEMPLTWRAAPLTMRWCLDCHRNPGQALRPAAEVYDLHWQPRDPARLAPRLLRDYHIDSRRLTDCSVCHR
ncbi:MAG: cytochrome c3 family protein [Gammaproteobacteria bacterium]|nr:cytochrome c3 family protein [Gammaproteobacteria bacterium]